MQHNFDIAIAESYGVNTAIFLNNLAFWIHRNMANEKHFHDGRYWTYNSVEAYKKIFPYWSTKVLRNIIEFCVKNKLILKGNYNENKYNRSSWYALTDKGLALFPWARNDSEPAPQSICPKRQINSPSRTNEFAAKDECITDIKPDKKTNKKQSSNLKSLSSFVFTKEEMQEAQERDIDIQKCFNKFLEYLPKSEFSRKDWVTWFKREKNGRKAVNKHLQKQLKEHEERKKLEMGDRFYKMEE